jgi:hypothetical protein
MTEYIKVQLGDEVAPGVWQYSVARPHLEGRSRQPILDACRQLKSMGAPTHERVALFRRGFSDPDISCTVGVGAATTVLEDRRLGPRFGTFQPFDPGRRPKDGRPCVNPDRPPLP